jgi:hypothetical protein
MHNAPPVAFPVGRFVWGRALMLGLAWLSALGLIGWQVFGQASVGMKILAWIFWAMCVGTAAAWCPRQALTKGRVFWSGEAWLWQLEGNEGRGQAEEQRIEVSVGLDMGFGLLLFVRMLDEQGQSCGRLVSAWLQERTMPSKWHGFRCAVYSRPKTIQIADEPL